MGRPGRKRKTDVTLAQVSCEHESHGDYLNAQGITWHDMVRSVEGQQFLRANDDYARAIWRRHYAWAAYLEKRGQVPGRDGEEVITIPARPGRKAQQLCVQQLDRVSLTEDQRSAAKRYEADLHEGRLSALTAQNYENVYAVEQQRAYRAVPVEPARTVVYEDGAGNKVRRIMPDKKMPRTFNQPTEKKHIAWRDLQPLTLDAIDRLNDARAAVIKALGEPHAIVLDYYLREQITFSEIAKKTHYGRRAKVSDMFKEALDVLVKHYLGVVRYE